MKIVAIPASLRADSVNKKLLAQASAFAGQAGATVTTLDLRDFPLPSFDGDIEAAGMPENVTKLHTALNESRVLMIASPEYNYAMPGHFKNTFDWISRIRPMPWSGKIVLLMSASPSLVGGNRGLWSLRVPFEGCGSVVYPEMFSLSSAFEAFDANGKFKDAKQGEKLAKNVKDFVTFATKVVG